MTEQAIQLQPEELAMVRQILQAHVPDRDVRVFGSRARAVAKPYSDLDLAIMGATPLPSSTLGMMREAFADSELPWRVDVLDWASTPANFRKHITEHSLPLPGP
jgi:predicted nucleotidyltransferase